MTTINQQIEFIQEVRESHDNNQREQVTTKRAPEQIAELLRDIEENLIAVRLIQLNPQPVEFCTMCNRPTNGNTYVIKGEKLCTRCAQKSFDLATEIIAAKNDTTVQL